MSRLHERLNAWQRIDHEPTRKSFEQTKEIFRLLENLLLQGLGRGNAIGPGPGIPRVTDTIAGEFILSYPMRVNANSQLFPNGVDINFGGNVKVTEIEIQGDPNINATANTTFLLTNGSPFFTGSANVTIPSGQSIGKNVISLTIGSGQLLYIKAPAVLNRVQNLYMIHIRFKRL